MTYTQDWIHNKDIIPHWERVLLPLKGQQLTMLEIGCYEGRSTVWFLENVLTHENSEIDVIDTFQGDSQTLEMAGSFDLVKQHFLENIEPFSKKVNLFIGTSEEKLLKLIELGMYTHDIAYIDGSHMKEDVLSDAILSWKLLKKGGIMLFDDYAMDYTDKEGVYYAPKQAIDAFISCHSSHIEILHKGWQYIVKKI